MDFILQIPKKYRFVISAAILGIYVYLTSVLFLGPGLFRKVFIGLVVVFAGVFFSHYPNLRRNNFYMALLMPFVLLIGALLSLFYFPNLGGLFKLFVVGIFSFLYYLILLADNIFLVVNDRKEPIPLYRVAVTWGQILLVIIAIPLFTGLLKLPLNPLAQSFLTGVTSFLFVTYLIWSVRFDSKSKTVGTGESVLLSLLNTFFVSATTIAVSFLPTESFLRAIFVSSILMFGLVYVSSYLKNEINKRLLIEYLIIFLVFFVLLIVFTP